MVHSCCVVGCANRQNKEKGIALHRIPKYPLWRRESWIKNINRLHKDSTTSKQNPWTPTDTSRVCSIHFIEGKPNEQPSHPDFIPTQHLRGKRPLPGQSIQRYERSKKRKSNSKPQESKFSTISEETLVASALIDLGSNHSLTANAVVQTLPLVETKEIESLKKEIESLKKELTAKTQNIEQQEKGSISSQVTSRLTSICPSLIPHSPPEFDIHVKTEESLLP